MANLDGSRSHGGKWDILAGAMLREDSAWFTDICRLLLRAARAEGIDRDRLPDFLDLEDGSQLWPSSARTSWAHTVFESALQMNRLPAACSRDDGPRKIPNGSSWPRPASDNTYSR